MELQYRYLAFALTILTLLHDTSSRCGVSLAMIGGMVKMNCTDPGDTGEFCWSDQLQASLLGAFYYGYTLQCLPTFLAAKVGFSVVLRAATLISAVIQLTFPALVETSPIAAVTLQAIRGLGAGIFIPNCIDTARRWSLGKEAGMLVAMTGCMMFVGTGMGPFTFGLLSKYAGWRWCFYVSGGGYILLFLLTCLLLPQDPLDARLMPRSEKERFQRERGKVVEENKKGKPSIRAVLGCWYVWSLTVYNLANCFLFYSDLITSPFFFNGMYGTDSEFLGWFQLALSLMAAILCLGWKVVLPLIDKRIPWLPCRLGFLLIPMFLRGITITVLPFTKTLTASVAVLAVNPLFISTIFAGSMMTISYEIDPVNSPVAVGVFNGFGQVAGFINPVLMAALTDVAETRTDYAQAYARGWRNFFFLNGGAAVVSIAAVLGGFAMRRDEWKMHPSLERRAEDVKKGPIGETERSRVYANRCENTDRSRCDNLELN